MNYTNTWLILSNCNSDDCFGEFGRFSHLQLNTILKTMIRTRHNHKFSGGADEYLEEYNDDGGDDSDHWHGDNDCGELVYPLTIQNSNGDQITGESEEELQVLLEEWYSNNCNTIECDYEFEIVFPVSMVFENDEGDEIVYSIQSEEMYEELAEQYCGD